MMDLEKQREKKTVTDNEWVEREKGIGAVDLKGILEDSGEREKRRESEGEWKDKRK